MDNPKWEPLSTRQAEIAAMVAQGKTNREIAGALHLSPRTVDAHIAAIFNKLGVRSKLELMAALLRPVVPETGHAAALSLRSVDAIPNNLPRKLTSFIGREAEIAEIAALVGTHQLVTLVGSGGVGKTRTSLAVAEGVLGAFPDGVWFVEFAPLSLGAYIPGTVAQALGLTLAGDGDPVANLARALKSKHLLLVFDNCEHLINDVAKAVAVILKDCHTVKLLATSREPLRLHGEARYRVPSLSIPPRAGSAPLSVAVALDYVAVALFVERARAIDHRFTLTEENASVVGDICRRLDGIPLAIELAAARVTLLSPHQLRDRLNERFRVLTGGGRDRLPRHQTLRALIDWSYDLLTPAEKELFERLSIFAGGTTIALLEGVYADEIDKVGLLTLVELLVDKSLVSANVGWLEPRYGLVESTRQYAYEKLQKRGAAQIIARRHALAYLGLSKNLERVYDASPNHDWYERAEVELPNWRAALTWAFSTNGDLIVGQRLVAHLAPVWNLSYAEGRRWTEAALDSADSQDSAHLRAQLEYAAAHVACLLDNLRRSLELGRRCLKSYLTIGDQLGVTRAEYLIGVSLAFLGRFSEAEPFLLRALTTARSLQNRRLAALALRNLAYVRSAQGFLDEARAYAVQELAIWDSMDAPHHKALGLQNHARIEFNAGNIERARDLALLSVSTLREFGFGSSLLPYAIQVLTDISEYLIAANRWDEGRLYACEALTLAQETAHELLSLCSLQHLAACWILPCAAQPHQSAPRLAAGVSLLGYIDARLVEIEGTRLPGDQLEYERLICSLAAVLPESVVATLMKAGALMTAAQVMEIAQTLAMLTSNDLDQQIVDGATLSPKSVMKLALGHQ